MWEGGAGMHPPTYKMRIFFICPWLLVYRFFTKICNSDIRLLDRNGRTALHYAAALSEFDEQGMYGWLMNTGADNTHQDNVS